MEQNASLSEVQFREARRDDAPALLELKRQLDQETRFMLLEAGERNEQTEDVAGAIRRVEASPNSALIVADTASGLVGYVEATGGAYRRNRATAEIVIGVLAWASSRSIGRGLLSAIECWAVTHGVHRLELTVMAANQRAIRLYERAGFLKEGHRNECLIVDGEFMDELYMAKLLAADPAMTPVR